MNVHVDWRLGRDAIGAHPTHERRPCTPHDAIQNAKESAFQTKPCAPCRPWFPTVVHSSDANTTPISSIPSSEDIDDGPGESRSRSGNPHGRIRTVEKAVGKREA